MSIDVTRTDDALRARFPIELNGSFRAQFKTARWNPAARAWEIKNHPRNDAKLQSWIKEVEESNVLETLRLAKEIEREDLDLSRLRSELGQLRQQIERARDLAARLAEVKAALAEARPALDAARREAAQAEREAERARRDVRALLEGALDLEAVREAHATMARYCRQVGSPAKERYHAAQATICRERARLAAAGFRSRGLDALAGANFNRPDRDDPGKITPDDLLDASPISPPEESA